LARPAIAQHELRENVVKRVRLWKETEPYFTGQDRESRGTEAVLNALILSSLDAAQGKLTGDARLAFDNLWATQDSTGAWPWINFHNEPWEAGDSGFYGACLAAIAVGTAHYQVTPKSDLLRGYLQREYSKQPLIHQVFLLWASGKWPDLLTADQRNSITSDLLKEQRDDGGWSLSSLAWSWRSSTPKALIKLWMRSDETPLHAHSDGLATGLAAFALQQAGIPRNDPRLQRGLEWLAHNQNPDGSWRAYSLNEHRDLTPGPGLFMTDAATAYAVLALTY
jgi:hypothetical protein